MPTEYRQPRPGDLRQRTGNNVDDAENSLHRFAVVYEYTATCTEAVCRAVKNDRCSWPATASRRLRRLESRETGTSASCPSAMMWT